MKRRGLFAKLLFSRHTLGAPLLGQVDVIFVEKLSFIVYISVALAAFVAGGKEEGWSALLGGAIVIANFGASAILIWRATSGPKIRWHYFPLVILKFLAVVAVCGWLLYRGLVRPMGFAAGMLTIFISITISGLVAAASPAEEEEETEADRPQSDGKRRTFFED